MRKLPTEILLRIFGYLSDPSDIVRAACVCRLWLMCAGVRARDYCKRELAKVDPDDFLSFFDDGCLKLLLSPLCVHLAPILTDNYLLWRTPKFWNAMVCSTQFFDIMTRGWQLSDTNLRQLFRTRLFWTSAKRGKPMSWDKFFGRPYAQFNACIMLGWPDMLSSHIKAQANACCFEWDNVREFFGAVESEIGPGVLALSLRSAHSWATRDVCFMLSLLENVPRVAHFVDAIHVVVCFRTMNDMKLACPAFRSEAYLKKQALLCALLKAKTYRKSSGAALLNEVHEGRTQELVLECIQSGAIPRYSGPGTSIPCDELMEAIMDWVHAHAWLHECAAFEIWHEKNADLVGTALANSPYDSINACMREQAKAINNARRVLSADDFRSFALFTTSPLKL